MTTALEKPVKREVSIGEDRYHVVLDYRGVFMRKVKAETRQWQCINWAALAAQLPFTDIKPQAAPVEASDLPDGPAIEAEAGDEDI